MGWTGTWARGGLWLLSGLLLIMWSAAQATSSVESAGRLLSYQEWTGPGGMRVLLVQDPGSDRTELTVHVPFGSFHEPREFGGLAHLREHLVGFGRSPGAEAFIPWVKQQALGEHWFKTRDQDTVYFAAVESAKSLELLDRLRRALLPRAYLPDDVRQQIGELQREWRQFQGQDSQVLEQLESFAAAPSHPISHFRSGDESSLPVSQAGKLALMAQRMTEEQHKDCALSWLVVSPLPLAEMKQVFEAATRASLAPARATLPCRTRDAWKASSRPVWQKAFAGRLAAVDGFDEAEELWLVLASTNTMARDMGAFWVSQIEGGHEASLRRQLQARGWIHELSAQFDARYFGSADRWWLRLHLTEQGRAQLPALRQGLDAWSRQQGSSAAGRRFEDLASESRRWSPVASRAQWGFQLATALSRCSGAAVFQHCGRSFGRGAAGRALPPLRSRDWVTWRVPHDRAQRLAWLDRWRQHPPRAKDWPTLLTALPTVGVTVEQGAAQPFPGFSKVPESAQIMAAWQRLGWAVCQHSGDGKEPFVATVKARMDLAALSDVDRVRVLLALEWRRSRDGPLGAVRQGGGQMLEWRLYGSTVELLARGRRDWQPALMHAWLHSLGGHADTHSRLTPTLTALRKLASEEQKDPVFDALVTQMARDAGQVPAPLGSWLQAWDDAQGHAGESTAAVDIAPGAMRLWVAEGPPRTMPSQGCEAPPSVDEVPWHDLGGVDKAIALPSSANASALVLRCGPFDAQRFWAARQSRAALRFQLRTLAREQGLDIPFISVAAFALPKGSCWGAFAEAPSGALPNLAEALRRLLSMRASMFASHSAESAGHLDWRLPIPSCTEDAEGWAQVWGLGWPATLSQCPFRGPDGVPAPGFPMEVWLESEWADRQVWRVYRGVPAQDDDD